MARDVQSSLELLAEDTGGVRVGTLALDKGFDRIVETNSRYYVLGYYSSVERDGRYHSIAVQVSRPDVTVEARRGFRTMSPPAKGRTVDLPRGLSPGLRAALEPGEATGTLPIDTTATLFRGERFDGSIVVDATVQGGDTRFADGETVRFAAVAYDEWGRLRAATQRTFTLSLTDAAQVRTAVHGLRFTTRMSLPYGSYQIRTVVEREGGGSGISTSAVEVPDFTDGILLVSDLLVSAVPQSSPLTLLADEKLRRALPGAPTSARHFPSDRELAVYTEIHDSRWLLSPELGVRWNVMAQASGAEMARGESRVASVNGRAVFQGAVPLTALGPGAYVLTVDAFTVAGIPAAGSRQLPFEVLPDVSAPAAPPPAYGPNPRFEAVSITRIRPACGLFALSTRCEGVLRPPSMIRFLADGTFEATHQTVAGLIAAAYGVPESRHITGGPGWLWTDGYDVVGVSGPGTTPDTAREMLRAMLAERFELRVRIEPTIVDETGLEQLSGRGRLDVTERERSSAGTSGRAPVEPRTVNTVVIERVKRPDED